MCVHVMLRQTQFKHPTIKVTVQQHQFSGFEPTEDHNWGKVKEPLMNSAHKLVTKQCLF